MNGHISFIEKNYNDHILPKNKQSEEEVLSGRAVKTTIQILYDKGFFDLYEIPDKILIFKHEHLI